MKAPATVPGLFLWNKSVLRGIADKPTKIVNKSIKMSIKKRMS